MSSVSASSFHSIEHSAKDAQHVAVELDKNEAYEEARDAYKSCIGSFLQALKLLQTDDPRRSPLRAHIEALLSRLEAITAALRVNAPPPSERPVTKPNALAWDDIVGMEECKDVLVASVEMAARFPALEEHSVRGVLLYGPPGTGKTMLARTLASQNGAILHSISAADVLGMYLGVSEKNVRDIFARIAASNADGGERRAVLFLDEVDALFGTRSANENDAMLRVKNEFLQQLEGVTTANASGGGSKRPFLLVATNRPEALDEAFLRRLDKHVYVPLPDAEARTKMLASKLAKCAGTTTTTTLSPSELQNIVARTERFSGADLDVLLRTARDGQVQSFRHANHLQKDETTHEWHVCKCPRHTPCPESVTWRDIPKNSKLRLPPLSFAMLDRALQQQVATCTPETIRRLEAFRARGNA